MTVFEIADETASSIDAGLAFPRDEHLGVDLILPDFGYLARSRRPGGRPDPRARRPRRRPAVPAARDPGARDLGDAPDARPRQVEARRARPAARDRAARDRARRGADRPRPVPARVRAACRTRSPTRSASASPRRPAASSTRATGSSITRRSTGCAPTSASSPRSANRGVDLLLGDSTNAERPGFTRSERVVGEAFRQIIPPRQGRVLISSFASNIHRMQQAIDVAAEVDRKVAVVGRSMRKNLNIARNLGYVEAPEDILVRPRRPRRPRRRAAADPLHRLAGRAAVRAHADRLQRPSGGARSSAATR